MIKKVSFFLAQGLLLSAVNAETIQPRIIDGTDTTPAAHPSYVVVDMGSSMCSGTLIAKQWVLTAAHCLTENDEPISASSINVAIHPSTVSNDIINAGEWVGAETFYRHPQYDFPSHDIGLIKLERAVSSTVATLNNNNGGLVGMNATAVGMGSTTRQYSWQYYTVIDELPSVLQEATIPIISRDYCVADYGDDVPANVICAGTVNHNAADTCSGDSGGPLFINRNGQKLQAGIVSFGSGCGVGSPAAYTDVSQYDSFVRQYVSDVSYSGGGVETISNVTGVWYDPANDGFGFTFMQSNIGLSAIYYGYYNDGAPQWLLTTSTYENDIVKGETFTLPLNTSSDNNGATFTQAPTTASSGTESWGSLSLTFTGCNSATAVLNGIDGTKTLQLVKLVNPKDFSCTE